MAIIKMRYSNEPRVMIYMSKATDFYHLLKILVHMQLKLLKT